MLDVQWAVTDLTLSPGLVYAWCSVAGHWSDTVTSSSLCLMFSGRSLIWHCHQLQSMLDVQWPVTDLTLSPAPVYAWCSVGGHWSDTVTSSSLCLMFSGRSLIWHCHQLQSMLDVQWAVTDLTLSPGLVYAWCSVAGHWSDTVTSSSLCLMFSGRSLIWHCHQLQSVVDVQWSTDLTPSPGPVYAWCSVAGHWSDTVTSSSLCLMFSGHVELSRFSEEKITQMKWKIIIT